MMWVENGRAIGERRAQSRRNKWLLLAWVMTVMVLSGVGMLAAAYYAPADNPVRILPDMGAQHVGVELPAKVYVSRPPTSGPHRVEEVRWGEHTTPVSIAAQLHALEDGAVILHYNCPDGCPAVVAALRGVVDEVGTDHLILHPYAEMDSPIAVTAWTRLLELDTVDRAAIVAFIREYRGVGKPG